MQNVFVDDRGFPDETKHYEALLRNVDGGVILRKLKHPPPSLDKVDPLVACPYDEAKHGEQMRRDLNLSHLEPQVRDRVYNLITKYWPVFDTNRVFVPAKNYECVIDTGDSLPIAVKKISMDQRRLPS